MADPRRGRARGYLTLKLLEHAGELSLDIRTGTRVPLGERFDLVCGTSTGGIIAWRSRSAIRCARYLRFRDPPAGCDPAMRRMFQSASFGLLLPRRTRAMQRRSSATSLADVRTDVLRHSHLACQCGPQLFRSDYLGRWAPDSDTGSPIWRSATSAAPTFFTRSSDRASVRSVDGGLYANNPALLGWRGLRLGRPSRRWVAPPHDLGGHAWTGCRSSPGQRRAVRHALRPGPPARRRMAGLGSALPQRRQREPDVAMSTCWAEGIAGREPPPASITAGLP